MSQEASSGPVTAPRKLRKDLMRDLEAKKKLFEENPMTQKKHMEEVQQVGYAVGVNKFTTDLSQKKAINTVDEFLRRNSVLDRHIEQFRKTKVWPEKEVREELISRKEEEEEEEEFL